MIITILLQRSLGVWADEWEDDKEGRVHPRTISVQPPEEQSL